jgi:hypothetical protein
MIDAKLDSVNWFGSMQAKRGQASMCTCAQLMAFHRFCDEKATAFSSPTHTSDLIVFCWT